MVSEGREFVSATHAADGYLVTYKDGVTVLWPKEVFERATELQGLVKDAL